MEFITTQSFQNKMAHSYKIKQTAQWDLIEVYRTIAIIASATLIIQAVIIF